MSPLAFLKSGYVWFKFSSENKANCHETLANFVCDFPPYFLKTVKYGHIRMRNKYNIWNTVCLQCFRIQIGKCIGHRDLQNTFWARSSVDTTISEMPRSTSIASVRYRVPTSLCQLVDGRDWQGGAALQAAPGTRNITVQHILFYS